MKPANANADVADYDDTAVDSSDDIPSRSKLKIASERRIEAQRLEEMEKRKKSTKPKPSQTQGEDYSRPIETDATEPKILNLTSPSKSRPRAHNSKEDPMDRVQAFLTELPLLE